MICEPNTSLVKELPPKILQVRLASRPERMSLVRTNRLILCVTFLEVFLFFAKHPQPFPQASTLILLDFILFYRNPLQQK